MRFINHTPYHPEPLLERLVAEFDTSALTVDIKDSKSAFGYSGACYWPRPLIRVRINPLNSYPREVPHRTDEYIDNWPKKRRRTRSVRVGGPVELTAVIFLHEFSHYLDFQGGPWPWYPQIRADMFALRMIEKHDIGPILDPIPPADGRKVGRWLDPLDYIYFELPKSSEECTERINYLRGVEEEQGKRQPRFREEIRGKRVYLESRRGDLERQAYIRKTREELEGRKWAYIARSDAYTLPWSWRVDKRRRHPPPKVGDRVRVVKLDEEKATIRFEGRPLLWRIEHLKATPKGVPWTPRLVAVSDARRPI